MRKWLNKGLYKRYRGIKLNCFMYNIYPTLQLKKKHYNTVICKKWYALQLGFKQEARFQFINNNNKISRWAAKLGVNPFFHIQRGTPFIHHYSGVRTEENMEKKLINWSHNKDTEIVDIIRHSRKNKTYLKSNDYRIVENKFNIEL